MVLPVFVASRPGTMSTADINKARVEANIRRWSSLGIDHRNADHVATYLLAREQVARPRPQQVLDIIASQTLQHQKSARLSSDFWLVAKSSVVGEPRWLKQWRVSEEDLRDSFSARRLRSLERMGA
jgi:hypothetical protein